MKNEMHICVSRNAQMIYNIRVSSAAEIDMWLNRVTSLTYRQICDMKDGFKYRAHTSRLDKDNRLIILY